MHGLEPEPLEISAWWALALAWPALLVGEALVRRVRLFSEFNIPVPVIGGLTFALATLALHRYGIWRRSPSLSSWERG